MDLDELRAFIALGETGSFLAAADALRLSRTTLRRRIDALEVRVGVPLLYRSAQGVSVTEAGAALIARGRHLVQEATSVLSAVRDVGSEPTGVLRVLLPVGLPPHALIPVMAATRAAYPRLAIEVRLADDPLARPLDDVDLVVHLGPRIADGPWVSRIVTRLRVHLVGSREYLERRGTPQTVADLASHELFAWRPPGGRDPRQWPTPDGEGIEMDPVLVASDIHTLRQLALEGHGLALIPDGFFPDPGYAPGTLVSVLPDLIGEECPFRIIVPESMSRSPKIRAVLERLEAFFESEA